MYTKIIKISKPTSLSKQLAVPAKIIQDGGLVVFPTETVYGLGADALNPEAVKNIFIAKGRPSDNPLIVHIADQKMLSVLAQNIPAKAKLLINKFWPGPLTIVLKKKAIIPNVVVACGKTVAIRMPANPIARELIHLSGKPIAAPSANLSGKPSPTIAKYVIEDMNGRVECIIDGGDCKFGLESTVIDLTTKVPLLLRPGAITLEQLRKVLGKVNVANPSAKKPKCPGMKYRHYAPNTKFILVEKTNPAYISTEMYKLIVRNETHKIKTAVICSRELYKILSHHKYKYVHFFIIGSEKNLTPLAHDIFKTLRDLDHKNYDCILMGACPDKGIGMAIMNRLRKAAHKIV
jgi:L-threonylcarbamoyladenylate synthase